MGRRNNTAGRRPQAKRRQDGTAGKRSSIPRIPIEQMVVPKGRCFFRNRSGRGKLSYTAAEVEKALSQARHNHKVTGSAKIEERYYECPPGGCGGFHLTSQVYDPTRA